MVACVDEFIIQSTRAESEASLRDLYLKAVQREGYQNAVCARACDRRLVAISWSHLPPGYSDNYLSNQWETIDPIVHHIHSITRPSLWDDICGRTHLNARERRFLASCRELGVHSGLTIPLHGPGCDVDLISLSLRDEKRVEPGRVPLVHALTVQYWLRSTELQGNTAPASPALTLKEMECLRWCKEGKTNWEIGEIMSISEKTVEYHLTNTIRKLGVSNRMTAVVKGIQLGIISI